MVDDSDIVDKLYWGFKSTFPFYDDDDEIRLKRKNLTITRTRTSLIRINLKNKTELFLDTDAVSSLLNFKYIHIMY